MEIHLPYFSDLYHLYDFLWGFFFKKQVDDVFYWFIKRLCGYLCAIPVKIRI
jgi:hypothetical protein